MALGPVTLIALVVVQASAAVRAPARTATDPLGVPYISQPAHLCGGAAIAMVERYWGRRGIYASDFAHLVREDLNGISTRDLEEAALTRGWITRIVHQTSRVRESLRAEIPVIALIEVAPGRNHYVVVLSWDDRTVTYHDPAIAPSRSMPTVEFDAQWAKTGRWGLTLVPDTVSQSEPPRETIDTVSATPRLHEDPCHGAIQRAAAMADHQQAEAAAVLLVRVRPTCADSAPVTRALAGIRFRQQRWKAASRLAASYVRDAPGDSHGWSLLGASLYLSGDRNGALDAWNAIGQPTIDLVTIDGLDRTRFRAVADALGLEAGDLLQVESLEHARRRLRNIPAVQTARIAYEPVGRGAVEVHARILEREWSGGSALAIGTTALRSIVRDEMRLDLVGITGSGEHLRAAWTWPSARRRVHVSLAVPAPFGGTGTLYVNGELARETFVSGAAGPSTIEERRTAEIAYGDWVSSRVQWKVGAGIDRWNEVGDYGMTRMVLTVRPLDDRVAVSAHGGLWISASSKNFARVGLRADWRSTAQPSRTVVSARVGIDHVTAEAPRMTWPSAGNTRSGSVWLRAHPLLEDDITVGATLGRTLIHGGVAADRWVARLGMFRAGIGAFIDAASVEHPQAASHAGIRLDAGAGILVGTGFGETLLRIDAAQAVLDAGRTVSLSLSTPWPY